MPPSDAAPIESTGLTLRDAVYIVSGLAAVVMIAITAAGLYWHLAGRADLQDQRMESMVETRDKAIVRRDKQIDDLQRINTDQDQRITALRSDYGDVRVQLGELRVKQDDALVLLHQIADGKAGAVNR